MVGTMRHDSLMARTTGVGASKARKTVPVRVRYMSFYSLQKGGHTKKHKTPGLGSPSVLCGLSSKLLGTVSPGKHSSTKQETPSFLLMFTVTERLLSLCQKG